MTEPHVVTALIKKRRAIAGQIEHAETTMRQLVIDLDNLDHTLRLFAPDIGGRCSGPEHILARPRCFRPSQRSGKNKSIVSGTIGLEWANRAPARGVIGSELDLERIFAHSIFLR